MVSRCRAFSAVRYAQAVERASLVANRVTAIAIPAATLKSASDMGPGDVVSHSASAQLNPTCTTTGIQKTHVEHIAPPMHQHVRYRVPGAKSLDCRANAPSNSTESPPSCALVGAHTKRPGRVERPCDLPDNEPGRGKLSGDEVLGGQRHRLAHTRYVSPEKLPYCAVARRPLRGHYERFSRVLHNMI